MEISVTDFSAPIGASVFKFCVHLQEGKLYCVNENKCANVLLLQFFRMSLLYNTYGRFLAEFSQQLLDLGL